MFTKYAMPFHQTGIMLDTMERNLMKRSPNVYEKATLDKAAYNAALADEEKLHILFSSFWAI